MIIKYSFPKLTENLIHKLGTVLQKDFEYSSIPDDYKKFLLKNNGGFVVPGYIEDTDDTEHTEEIVFETPLKWVRDNNKPVTPSIVMFFGVWMKEEMKEEDVENWDLFDLVLSNEHSKNDFEILPDNMMSVAKCSHPDADDMLCISVDESDYGSVYFYYGMHHHPGKFMGSYYEDKFNHILKHYNIKDEEAIDQDTKEGQEIMYHLERVPFVKVADSLDIFLRNCKRVKTEV